MLAVLQGIRGAHQEDDGEDVPLGLDVHVRAQRLPDRPANVAVEDVPASYRHDDRHQPDRNVPNYLGEGINAFGQSQQTSHAATSIVPQAQISAAA
jgi:hypothetical protein